jgi:mannitol/fructose-specific phosphotransferase system IIA component (Ntr-type)
MDIERILNEKLIDLEMNVKTKNEAIQSLTNLLVSVGNIDNSELFIKDVEKQKEKLD